MSSQSSNLPYVFPERWQVSKLRDVCLKIGSGATPTGGQAAYLPTRQGWALIRSQNVFDRQFDATGLAFISDEQASGLQGVVLQIGDVLLNITGDGITFARACQVPESVLPAVVNQHVSIVRPNPHVASSGYVLAYLTHPAVKGYIEGFNAGGSRRALTKAHIESFEIPLPPMEEQRVIAQILGTLDDKIELNRRMNETLEAMARAIFQSWFVDFDPVRAKASGENPDSICQRLGLTPELLALFPDSFEGSELGEIPKGWLPTRLDDILELAYGKALKATNRIDGVFPVYGSGGVTGYHNESLIDGPAIIVGRKGTVGSLYWEDSSSYPIDTVFYVKPKVQLIYCHYLLQTLGLETMNTDAAVPGLNRNNVYRLLVALPSAEMRTEFERLGVGVRNQITANSAQIATLITTRDALLPKLLSGSLKLEG